MSDDFPQISYQLHIEQNRKSNESVPNIIQNEYLIDTWGHKRLYEPLRPLIAAYPNLRWMTIGDYGADAYFLRKMGCANVIATNIVDLQLQYLKESGVLSGIEVKAINAEQIALPDESVDLVLCKESYHHFPRPPIAFYEMLRVCREAVVLIEPREPNMKRPLDMLRVFVKTILRRKKKIEQLFEHCGNFIFRLSEKEITKAMIALQKDCVATKHLNSFYFAPIARKTVHQKIPMLIHRTALFVQDILCKIRLMNYGLVILIAFKKPPPGQLREGLSAEGFKIMELPKNPYLKS